MKIKAPCYQCPDRCEGCHGRCEKYLAYKEENDSRRDQKNGAQAVDMIRLDMALKRRDRYRKLMSRRK